MLDNTSIHSTVVATVFVALHKGIHLSYEHAQGTCTCEVIMRPKRMQLHLHRFTAHAQTTLVYIAVRLNTHATKVAVTIRKFS